ncbi:unannotated protein [freshwater metagenome]|uniref:Unannotated protein n=1 Tax=freshwater metagenome TaxID=449393 RepID=A0A6J6SKH1_9ZZZZ
MTTSSRPLRQRAKSWLSASLTALTSSSSSSAPPREGDHARPAPERGSDSDGFARRQRRFIRDLLEDPDWVIRRVETVTILSTSLRERRVSVDIDVTEVSRRARECGLDVEQPVCVPVSLLPKGLIFDFDARGNGGEPVSLANRAVDSEVAALLVVESAVHADPSLDEPPTSIGEILFMVTHSFPDEDLIKGLGGADGTRVLENLSDYFGIPVDASDQSWWLQAWQQPQFSRDLRHFADHFVSLVLLDLQGSSQILKLRRLEQGSDSSRVLAGDQVDPSDFSLAAYDVGRAASDHLRVVAPPGTFFTDAWLVRLTPGVLTYSERTALDRLAFYTHGVEPGAHFVYAKLWPQRGGFMRPAKYLSGYGAAVLILGALAEWWSSERWDHTRGFLWQLSGVSDAAATLALTLPTILVAYIVRDGEHDVRSRLLARWRALALLSLVPLWCATITLLIDRENLLYWTLGVEWVALGLIALIIHAAIQIQDFRLRRAYRSLERASPRTRDTSVTTSAPRLLPSTD